MIAENNNMSFFQVFQYCLGSGLGTIVDFSSEQLVHATEVKLGIFTSQSCNDGKEMMYIKRDARAKLLFCLSNVLLFCCSLLSPAS